MSQTDLLGSGRLHFVGIGGAGMSAIAKVAMELGASVSGSDLKRSRATTSLEAMGADVRLGHHPDAVDGAGLVVASSAIPAADPELVRARELNITVLTRGEALAALLAGRRSVIVAGTHGKTTTTSMIVTIMRHHGLDPTYLVGGGLNDVGTNARAGSDWAVAESDESDGSFLLLSPEIAVVTNIEADHLDHWGSFQAIRDGFDRFVDRIDPGGALVLATSENDLAARARARDLKVLGFGDGGDVWADDIEVTETGTRFTLVAGSEKAAVDARIRGDHNIANALAAAAACMLVEVPLADIASGLSNFLGVERRFQMRGESAGVAVVDDYAHHPTEVRATLAAARPGPWRRVVAVFQPHRYSRTAALSDDFGSAFADADIVVVTDVYGAGEQPVPGVSGKLISDSVARHLPGRRIAFLPHREDLLSYLRSTARPGDVVLTLGAGDISTVGEELLETLGAGTHT